MTDPNLVDKIAQFIERFVFIKDKRIYRLLALWIIQTHMCKDFEYTGYVFAHSPEPGSGKSRLLEVLDLLVANSSGLLYQPTDAVLFRTANEKTQLLDEIDTWPNGDFLRGVLNAGFHRGGTVLRNERRQDKWEPVAFPVYAPRAMAGIGSGILHGTTCDRTFIIEMVKQKPEERREKFRARQARPEADQLKGEAEAWVKQNRSSIVTLYDDAEKAFPYLAHLRDRTIDITEPLSAILEVAYGAAPGLAGRRLELLEAVTLTRKDGGEALADHRMLGELFRLASAEDPLIGSASELAAKCELDPRPTEYEVSQTLRRHNFETRSIRLGDSPRYRYELRRGQLDELVDRFGCGPTKSETDNSQAEPCGGDLPSLVEIAREAPE